MIKQRAIGPDGYTSGEYSDYLFLNPIVYEIEFPRGDVSKYSINVIGIIVIIVATMMNDTPTISHCYQPCSVENGPPDGHYGAGDASFDFCDQGHGGAAAAKCTLRPRTAQCC